MNLYSDYEESVELMIRIRNNDKLYHSAFIANKVIRVMDKRNCNYVHEYVKPKTIRLPVGIVDIGACIQLVEHN